MRRLFPIPLLIVAFACGDNMPVGPPVDGEIELARAAALKPAPSLSSTIEYVFVGHLGTVDSEGRTLVWDGKIHGDIEGQILWWFVEGGGPPNMPDAAHVSFYEGRWEIWDGDALLLAGNSAGSTAMPPGKDGIWRGNGIVTEAGAGFEDWNGRHVKEGGNVDLAFPYSGEGTFLIN